MNNMPKIGIGLDFKYLDRYPPFVKSIINDNCYDVTHLSIVGIESEKEAIAFREMARHYPIIHHLSNVSPCGFLGPNLSRMVTLDRISKELKSLWCGEDIGLWSIGSHALPYFAPPLFTAEVARYVAAGIKKIQRISSIPFLAEVPSVGAVVGDISLSDFFSILVEEADCDIVLDLSHIYSYALAVQESCESVLASFPLSRVREIHIAGGRISIDCPSRYIDSHSDQIMSNILKLLPEVIPLSARLEAVTYEIGVKLPESIFTQDFCLINESLYQSGFTPKIFTHA